MKTSLQPKFKVGDIVIHKRTGNKWLVLDVKYNKPVVTHAIVCREDGTSAIKPTTIAEYFSYKLNDGKSWRYDEVLLEKYHAETRD